MGQMLELLTSILAEYRQAADKDVLIDDEHSVVAGMRNYAHDATEASHFAAEGDM